MAPVPSTGAMHGGVHLYPVRVYYECTDAGGIVYHADYLRYAERARTEMMRLFGLRHCDLKAEDGVGFAVHQCEATFHRPAHLDDLLVVHTRMIEVGGATMRVSQNVMRDDTLLVALRLRLAMVTDQGRPGRVPAALRAALRTHLAAHPYPETTTGT
nr:YbgC/FadM family acyl-CoA thioesterase [Roseospira visakhapatnamensis]